LSRNIVPNRTCEFSNDCAVDISVWVANSSRFYDVRCTN